MNGILTGGLKIRSLILNHLSQLCHLFISGFVGMLKSQNYEKAKQWELDVNSIQLIIHVLVDLGIFQQTGAVTTGRREISPNAKWTKKQKKLINPNQQS